MGILNVTIGSINNTTGDLTEGYRDYSCTLGTRLALGTSDLISVRTHASSDEYVRVWIDYNNDGAFGAASELFFSSGPARLHTGFSNVIPTTAVAGIPLRMRVSADASSSPIPGPCTTPEYSQVEDYAVTLGSNTLPPVARFRWSQPQACTGTFNFFDQSQRGPTAWHWDFGDGQFSTQPTPMHTYGQAGQYLVRLRVCNAFGCDSTLVADTLNWYPALPVAAACTPATTAYCCGYGITRIAFAGQAQVSADGAAGYEDFTCRRRFVVGTGLTYPLRVRTAPSSHVIAAWLDANNDGQFSATEILFTQTSSNGVTVNVTIPAAAVTGVPLRLRITADAAGQPLTACTAPRLGQVEDYSVVVQPIGSCTRLLPLAPLRVVYDPCLGARARLELPMAQAEAALQWQSSADSLNWADVAGATAATYFTAPVTGPIYYRIKAYCGVQTAYSAGWPLDTAQYCYCRSLVSSGNCPSGIYDYPVMARVSISHSGFTTAGLPCSVRPDSTHHTFAPYPPNQTTTLRRQTAYELNVAFRAPSTYPIYAWIDYNRNHVFETAEHIEVSLRAWPNTITSAVFTVPVTAAPGLTGMRIRVWDGRNDNACDALAFGSTHDYTVTIAPDNCLAPLLAGTLRGTPAYCAGRAPTLSVQGQTPGTFLQWEISPDSSSWRPLAASHDDTLALTLLPGQTPGAWQAADRFVRVKVSCGTQDVYTPAVRVREDFQLCYCAPTVTVCGEPALRGVRLAHTTLLDRTTLCPTTSYRLADATQPRYRATLLRGVSYPLTITPGLAAGGVPRQRFDAVVWLDANQDGAFTADEQTVIRVHPASPDTTVSLTVPPSARLGSTRLRLVVRAADSGYFASPKQCEYRGAQEMRDYRVTILAPPPTTLPLTAGVIDGPTGVCVANAVLLHVQHFSFDATLRWQRQTPGGWLDVPGGTGATLRDSLIAPTTFRVVATRGAAVAYSAPWSVSVQGPCYCSSGLGSSGFSLSSVGIAIAGGGAHLLNRGPSPEDVSHFIYGPDSLTTTLYRGRAYQIGVAAVYPGLSGGIWFDYNHNGTFDPAEFTRVLVNNRLLPRTNTLTIPANAPLGVVRMRLRVAENFMLQGANSCTRMRSAYNAQDYLITIADPPAYLAPELAAPDTVCSGGTIRLRPTIPLPAGTTYEWAGPAGALGQGPQAEQLRATAAHQGYYYLTTTAPDGYRLTTARYVVVDGSCIATGLEPGRAPFTIQLAPNPAAGQTTLRVMGNAAALTVRLLSGTGQVLTSHILPGNTGSSRELVLSLRGYASGLYLVQVIGAEGVAYRKLVVE